MACRYEDGLSRDPAAIHAGGNGGHQATGLAFHLSGGPIVLTGFDMQRGPDGALHCHPDHPPGLNNPDEDSHFARWRTAFAALVIDLERAGVPVLNATRRTALDCCPRVPLAEALAS